MDEMRGRIPADAAAFHAARHILGIGEPPVEGDVERPPVDMLAPLGDAEARLRQPGIGLRRTVGGQHASAALPARRHDIGEKIERRDVERPDLADMMVTQELGEILHRRRDRPRRVAIGTLESLAGMNVIEPEAPCRRDRSRRGPAEDDA